LTALERTGFLTSDDALELRQLPSSIVILGGGAVAVEFAQFFQRLGVQTSLIQRSPHLLRHLDPDAAAVLETVFRREGMTVLTGTSLVDARRAPSGVTLTVLHDGQRVELTADTVLHAMGRRPNTAQLNLDAAGVRCDGARIVTDPLMRTSAPHIFAAGDCTGPHEIVHIAIQQGEIAAHNILHPESAKTMDYRLLTTVIFTEPQIACTGLSEIAAAKAGLPFRKASYPFNDHGKSIIMNATDGFVKLLAHPSSGEILGGSCVGPLAGELIHEIVAAMHQRMTAAQLASMPHYHPTLAEIWTYPAEELAQPPAPETPPGT
jgi:pyruvate/2-oxoglutarate dehydrogenase complex dihydrolipoamide dehydrogenase (E3) component